MNSFEERDTLERFKKLYDEFPDGKISQPDSPDFIVNGTTRIGIEISQVFIDQNNPDGSLIKAKETFRIHLLENIVEALNEVNFPKCIFSIDLNDQLYTKKLSARKITKDCLPDIISKQKEILNDGYYDFNNEGTLPVIIEGYTIGIYKTINKTDYIETTSTIGKTLTNDYIQFILDKKEVAKKKFKNCDMLWLLIKEGDFEGDYFGESALEKSELKTSFDKVFLLRRRNEELIELK